MLEGSRLRERGMVVDLGVGPVSRWGKGDPPRINTAAGRPPPGLPHRPMLSRRLFPLKNRMPFGACTRAPGKKKKISFPANHPLSLSFSRVMIR